MRIGAAGASTVSSPSELMSYARACCTPYSFTKVRVLFEIAYREQLTTSYLSRELGRDPGYLSRIVARLEQQGLIKKKRSLIDARRRLLSLTPRARAPSPCSIHARARRWARCSRSSPKGTSGVC